MECMRIPVIRLEWLHTKESRERWLEEEVMLVEECRRVGDTFACLRLEWHDRACQWGASSSCSAGHVAYARRQAAMFLQLEMAADAAFQEIVAHRPRVPQLLAPDHFLSLKPRQVSRSTSMTIC